MASRLSYRPTSTTEHRESWCTTKPKQRKTGKAHSTNWMRPVRPHFFAPQSTSKMLWRYHNKNVRERAFQVGDLVLRRIPTTKDVHKLTPPWEGPYIITEVIRLGSYRLMNDAGEVYTNSWNIEQLRRFYP